MMGFTILGTGSALPKCSVSNDELAEFLDTSDEWIRSRTGIECRRLCTTETLDELATTACQRALDAAHTTVDELDAIICSTTSGDHLVPAQACVIAELLGATCPAFDISAGCAGFVFGLDVADGWFARKRAKRILVVAAEKVSRLVDWSDRNTAVLFGDGAAAVVLGEPCNSASANPIAIKLETEPCTEALHVPGLPTSSPYDSSMPNEPCVLAMQGRRVFKFGTSTVCASIEAMCKEAGISINDIDHFILHQANERIMSAAITRLGIDSKKVERAISETGNISSACIPLILDRLVRTNRIATGNLVAMVGFGAGLDTGWCLLRWE